MSVRRQHQMVPSTQLSGVRDGQAQETRSILPCDEEKPTYTQRCCSAIGEEQTSPAGLFIPGVRGHHQRPSRRHPRPRSERVYARESSRN